jgi:hypothetical protein
MPMRSATSKTLFFGLCGVAAGLASACVVAVGPILIALMAVRFFYYLGWTRAGDIAAGVSTYYAFFAVIGVAVGLTVCLRIWGRRFRKEPDSPETR